MKKKNFLHPESHWRKDPDPEPDPLVRGDPDSDSHQNVTDPQHWYPYRGENSRLCYNTVVDLTFHKKNQMIELSKRLERTRLGHKQECAFGLYFFEQELGFAKMVRIWSLLLEKHTCDSVKILARFNFVAFLSVSKRRTAINTARLAWRCMPKIFFVLRLKTKDIPTFS